jgi:hypothetical protein
MPARLATVGVLLLSTSPARADHSHAGHHSNESVFGAGLTIVAASYDSLLYTGNYQGIVPQVTWANQRFAAGVNASLYRVEENGASYYGPGDIVAHGQVALVGGEHARAGVVAAVSAPVGDDRHGLGMGHPMVMPAAFGTWMHDRIALSATAGYSRALGGDTGHDHGMWPIVEPMNRTEVTWSTAGEVAITPQITCGARFSGGIPIGDGDHRIVGAVRFGWGARRFATAAELQAGIVGDPFNVRGVLSTTWSF